MHLSTHHKFALAAATVTSGIALVDAVTHGLTGHYSWFADDSGVRPAQVFSALAHGLTYAALCVVLVREAALIAAAGRVQSVLRWVLVTSLTLLAAGFVLVAPFLQSPDSAGAIGGALGILMSVGFVGLILGSLVLGPLLLRSPGLRTGARVLSAMLPVFGVTILMQFLATDWAHPAYLETTLAFGLALLGVDAVPQSPEAGSTAAADTLTAADMSTRSGPRGDRIDR